MKAMFPGMVVKEQDSKRPDVDVLPDTAKMHRNEMVGIKDAGYLEKKGTPSGLKAEFNFLPPGMNIEDQDNADIRPQKQVDYSGGLSYPEDGWY